MAKEINAAWGPVAVERTPSIIVAAAPKLALRLLGQENLCAPNHDLGSRRDVLHDVVIVGDRLVSADRMALEGIWPGPEVHPRPALPLHDGGVLEEHAFIGLARGDIDDGVHPGQQATVARGHEEVTESLNPSVCSGCWRDVVEIDIGIPRRRLCERSPWRLDQDHARRQRYLNEKLVAFDQL